MTAWKETTIEILAIIDKLEELDERSIDNIQVHRSLGRYLYHGLLALALDTENRVVCVGNSSSGIKETPVFGCPTVNIGSRQKGRLRGQNVLDADYKKESIVDAVIDCIENNDFWRNPRAMTRRRCFCLSLWCVLGDA